MPTQPTQEQMFWNAHRSANDILQQAAFMSGLLGENTNPLTEEEIRDIAAAGKPYSWAFTMIVEAKDGQRDMEQLVKVCSEGTNEDLSKYQYRRGYWAVTADHPILARPDKFDMTEHDAEGYADELRELGYENIRVYPNENPW